jgi:N-acetylmuramoyl-L-alanine amidase
MAVILTAAGHGGPDPGALNPYYPSRPEKVINLEIDEAFSRQARAAGHTVHRMRTGDTLLDLGRIVPTARSVGADVVIEIHVNSSFSSSANGVEVWALPNHESTRLAGFMAQNIAAAGFANRGVRNALEHPLIGSRFQQLTDRLHVLTENGFISNAHDEALLRQPAVIEAIAYGHLAGIHAYFGLPLPAPKIISWLLLVPAAAIGISALIWLRRE